MAICRKPYINVQGDICPCQQCPECLTNRKQLWTHRNILEGFAHARKSFVTLTYDELNLPINEIGNPTLVKEHLQTFFKNLRTRVQHPIRYYAVGEYGTSGTRGINPHYHAIIYGVDSEQLQEINDAWRAPAGRGKKGSPLGFVYVGDVTDQSIAYVTGYVQKKNKYNKDMYEELEIIPEYSTMSTAISLSAVPNFVKLFTEKPEYLTEYGDVPYSINHGDRTLPLGTYLREKIREGLNLPHDIETYYDDETGEIIEKKIWHGKEEQKAQRKAEMQILQDNTLIPDSKLPEDATVSVKKFYEYKNAQSKKQFDARQKFIHNSHSL